MPWWQGQLSSYKAPPSYWGCTAWLGCQPNGRCCWRRSLQQDECTEHCNGFCAQYDSGKSLSFISSYSWCQIILPCRVKGNLLAGNRERYFVSGTDVRSSHGTHACSASDESFEDIDHSHIKTAPSSTGRDYLASFITRSTKSSRAQVWT